MVEIKPGLDLPEDEIRFTFSRSGGPGGQNVNKVNTKVTLYFDISASAALTNDQKQLLLSRLGNRISRNGVLQLVSTGHRTQKANREDVLQRFAAMLASALYQPRQRKKTRVPARAKEARLQSKKRRGRLKAVRVKKRWDD